MGLGFLGTRTRQPIQIYAWGQCNIQRDLTSELLLGPSLFLSTLDFGLKGVVAGDEQDIWYPKRELNPVIFCEWATSGAHKNIWHPGIVLASTACLKDNHFTHGKARSSSSSPERINFWDWDRAVKSKILHCIGFTDKHLRSGFISADCVSGARRTKDPFDPIVEYDEDDPIVTPGFWPL